MNWSEIEFHKKLSLWSYVACAYLEWHLKYEWARIYPVETEDQFRINCETHVSV